MLQELIWKVRDFYFSCREMVFLRILLLISATFCKKITARSPTLTKDSVFLIRVAGKSPGILNHDFSFFSLLSDVQGEVV